MKLAYYCYLSFLAMFLMSTQSISENFLILLDAIKSESNKNVFLSSSIECNFLIDGHVNIYTKCLLSLV